jgi:hypothetical protein
MTASHWRWQRRAGSSPLDDRKPSLLFASRAMQADVRRTAKQAHDGRAQAGAPAHAIIPGEPQTARHQPSAIRRHCWPTEGSPSAGRSPQRRLHRVPVRVKRVLSDSLKIRGGEPTGRGNPERFLEIRHVAADLSGTSGKGAGLVKQPVQTGKHWGPLLLMDSI